MVVVVSQTCFRRQSDPHALRTLTSFAADLEDLSNQLLPGRRIFLAGASGGGPYALAAAVKMRDRVRGVLLISPASHPGMLAPIHDACMLAWTESTACHIARLFYNTKQVPGFDSTSNANAVASQALCASPCLVQYALLALKLSMLPMCCLHSLAQPRAERQGQWYV